MSANENRLKKAFYSAATSAVYQLAVMVCGFVTSRLIVGAYGSSWNGVVASITKFSGLFSVAEIGINGATRVALYKSFADEDTRAISAIINANDRYYRKIAFALVAYVLLLAAVLPLMVNAEIPYMQIFLMVLIIGVSKFAENCFGINSKILLAASQTNYVTNLVQTAATVLNALLPVMIVKAGGSVFAAKSGSSAILVMIPILLFIVSHRMFHIDRTVPPDDRALKGRWDVLANSLSNIVHENVDVLFITVFCASTELSVYAVYYTVADGLYRIFQIITNGLEASFGNMWVRGELEALRRHVRQYEYISYSLAALLFGCMTVLIVPFMSVYMRGIEDVNYMRVSLAVVMALAQIFLSIRMPYVLLVQAAGHYKQVKVAGYIEAGINILLTAVLVLRLGIVGALIGTIIANAFRTVMYGRYASANILDRPFSEIGKRFLWLAVVYAASVGLSAWLLRYMAVTGWLSWLCCAVVVFLVHAAVLAVASLLCYRQDMKNCTALLMRLCKR